MMKRSLILLSAMLLGVTLLMVSAHSQDDMDVVDDPGFESLRRPSATFVHDTHNENAGIDDCAVCHHLYDEQGNKVEDESSEDQSCSDCHGLRDNGSQPGLRKAFHRNCKGCHLERGKGPVTCGECHPKKG